MSKSVEPPINKLTIGMFNNGSKEVCITADGKQAALLSMPGFCHGVVLEVVCNYVATIAKYVDGKPVEGETERLNSKRHYRVVSLVDLYGDQITIVSGLGEENPGFKFKTHSGANSPDGTSLAIEGYGELTFVDASYSTPKLLSLEDVETLRHAIDTASDVRSFKPIIPPKVEKAVDAA